jgi:peptidyl-prolyl cis-trans isomerase C
MPDSPLTSAAAYARLKLAHKLYQKQPDALAPDERLRVEQVAARQQQIEQRILTTPEAAQVVLPASSLAQALAEIRARYGDEDEYCADLARADLDPLSLAASIERELVFNAVLERVVSKAPAISDTDVEIFYLLHRDRFRRPELRTLRHILMTLDDSLNGSDRATLASRMESLRQRLLKAPERFAEQALKHSECPTAMNGGLLGRLQRGQLYAELEPVAFALAVGELSVAVESPLGFHLIYCEAIEAASQRSLEEVSEQIRTHLRDSRHSALQKAWIAGLFRDDARRLQDPPHAAGAAKRTGS